MRSVLLSWALLLALLGNAWAGALDKIREGNDAFRQGELQVAIEAFTEAIASGELDAEAMAVALNNRAVTYDQLGDYDRAVRDYEQALSLVPEEPTTKRNLRAVLIRRGVAAANRGQYERALADLGRAIELDPENYLAWLRRAEVRMENGDLKGAERDLEQASALEPGLPEIEQAASRLAALETEAAGSSPRLSSSEAPEMPTQTGMPGLPGPAAASTPREARTRADARPPEPARPGVAAAVPKKQAPPTGQVATAERTAPAPASAAPAVVTKKSARREAPAPGPAIAQQPERSPKSLVPESGEVSRPTQRIARKRESAPAAATAAKEASGGRTASGGSKPVSTARAEGSGRGDAGGNAAARPAASRKAAAGSRPTGGLPGNAAGGERYRAIAHVNVRSGPGNDYPPKRVLAKGTVVRVVREKLGWKEIVFQNGDHGYVYKKWLEPVSSDE